MAYQFREARRAREALAADPDDTVEAIHVIGAMSDNSPERCFERFARRLRELHDVFHMLTGYGPDMRGKMGRVIRQGYWRGRRAQWLIDQDWEALLPRPLEQLRGDLGVGPAPDYGHLHSPGAPVLAN